MAENLASTPPQDKNADLKSLASSFTVFPELPVEIRFKIWKAALPGRRYLTLNFYGPASYFSASFPPAAFYTPLEMVHANLRRRMDYCQGIWEASWVEKTPALLHVCKESRQEALKVYKPVSQVPYKGKTVSFIDPEMDVVVLPVNKLVFRQVALKVLQSLNKQDIHLKYLAVHITKLRELICTPAFRKLEALMVIMTDKDWIDGSIEDFDEFDQEAWHSEVLKDCASEQRCAFWGPAWYNILWRDGKSSVMQWLGKTSEGKAPRLCMGAFKLVSDVSVSGSKIGYARKT
jgi:hypothetical protein